ncbi:hypothetical protein O181_012855 [Austropuccinia psidii MF-1]|uniref:Uncharacterized protein n=1 Tax=Austropuccinia psidii MF-1 TaxID=1389203 RepID=A0A9Q3GNC5_9BASI|nr:hypothetical protein [Austropuccinia psidii MF-1]
MKLLLLEVEVTTPSNQMDLDQDIQVINPKEKFVSPEERHKRRMPELPPVPKDLNHFQQATIEMYQSQYKNCEEAHGPRNERGYSEGLDTHVLKRTNTKDISLAEKPKHVVRGQEGEIGPRKGQQPSGISPSLHKKKPTSTSAKKGKANPKEQSEGQGKGKRKQKGKAQVEQALPTELQNYKEREDSHGQCVQYGKSSDGIQNQGGVKNETILSKEINLVKLVNHFETCDKEILENLKNSEYIQQKLVRETLPVKDSQQTIIGL